MTKFYGWIHAIVLFVFFMGAMLTYSSNVHPLAMAATFFGGQMISVLVHTLLAARKQGSNRS